MTESQASDPQSTLRSTTGQSLNELSAERPILVAFLRHSGCTFCRELLGDLAQRRKQIEAAGIGIVLVHLERDADVAELAARYGLADVPRIADREQHLYEAFELRRMSPVEMLNPAVWLGGFRTAILKRHGFGRIKGDVLQMPGVFLVKNGEILAGYRHKTPASSCDIGRLIASTEKKPTA
ncbi:redoxin domain-containing protein [bacterium]|nr:redoxin domain-containing protein [bacterium]